MDIDIETEIEIHNAVEFYLEEGCSMDHRIRKTNVHLNRKFVTQGLHRILSF